MTLSMIFAVIAGGALAGMMFCLCSQRLAAILQQEGYDGKAFLKWYYRSRNIERKKASILALAVALLTALFCVCFSFAGYAAANLISVVPFFGITLFYYFAERKHALKVPARLTARYLRLIVGYAVFMFALCIGFAFALTAISLAADLQWLYLLRFVPFCLVPLFLSLIHI